MKCEICNREFNNNSGFIQHIVYGHKITKKDYYDKYHKKEGEGICPVCGNETNFKRNGFGYLVHCSVQCVNKNPKTREKIIKTNIERFGVANNTQLDYYKKLNREIWGNKSIKELENIREKSKNTCLERYGKDNPAKSEKTKEKMKETCLKKYGVEWALESKDVIEKRRLTCIEKYGVENIFQRPDIVEKIREDMIKRGYCVMEEDYTKFKNYYKKCINLTRKNIRNSSFEKDWNGLDYYDNEYIKDNYELYNHNQEEYPNIDHKISILYGFLNNISYEDISSIDNLCFTKRRHNASKRAKIEEEYIKKVVS